MDDDSLIALWLHGRSPATQRAYRADLAALRVDLKVNLAAVTLAELQAFADGLQRLAPRSQSRRLSAVKSFFAFHARLGTLPANPAAALALPKVANDLAERILAEDEIARLLAAAETPRDRAMVRLLYVSGLRAAELCGLRWRNITPRGDGEGQIAAHGKGGKTRFILLPAPAFAEIAALRGDGKPGDPVFPAVRGGGVRPIAPRQLLDVVKGCARRAGLTEKVSNHWMRHAHASHALDNGAPISLVQATLGHASVATTSKYLHARPGASSAQFLKAP